MIKSRGGKIFEFVHCPFEGRANMHHKIQPNWLTGQCCLAGGSKGQCRKSKFFLSLYLPMQVDQYISFPETCFAPTISEPEFTVCTVRGFGVKLLMTLVRHARISAKNRLKQTSPMQQPARKLFLFTKSCQKNFYHTSNYPRLLRNYLVA